MVRVSVVTPTNRRPDLLDRCLAALLAQDIDSCDYEVIVVDDAACDVKRQQIERWASRGAAYGHTVRYLPATGGRGPAAARNRGWRAARAPIIAFTDDDCVPAPGWLRAGLIACAPDVAGTMGRIVVPVPHRSTDYERDAAHISTAEFVTANCFYRRAVLAAAGGFDERFTAAWREDSDLFFTLLECGARLAHAPDAVVVHPIRPARWGVSLAQQRKSMFNALLYKKHPALYRRRIQAAPPWRYYVAVAALLTAAAAHARQRRACALVAGCVWVIVTARFCARRLRGTSHASRHVVEMAVTSALIPPLTIYWRLRGALTFRVWFI
jgi:GT2 family glycosyltransferase